MSDIFGIGVSALNAAQAGIMVTGNNISNANTPGYSRQQIIQTTNIPQATGAGFFGQGTQVETVKRAYSSFLTNQVNQTQTQSSQLSTYSTQINQIDNLLGSNGLGLAPAIQGFFSAVQGVANNASSIPSRQAMLSASQTMVSTFQNLDQQLSSLRTGVNSQIANSVTLINSYAQQIAQLNQNILAAQGAANGQPPNDLLDQRDQLVAQLSKEVQTTVAKQSDGSYNIIIGTGQSLVVGNQATTLVTAPNPADPSNTAIGYPTKNGTAFLPDSSLTGGNLGGLLAFRSQSLDPAQNALGRIAIGLAQTFNAQQQLGQDLNGNLGTAYFNVPGPSVSPNPGNGAGSAVSASLTIAAATSSLAVNANLTSSATVPTASGSFSASNSASYNYTTSSTVYDSLGQSHTANLYYVNTAPDVWNVYTTIDGASANPTQTNASQLSEALAAASAAATAAGASASQITDIRNAITAAAASPPVASSAIAAAASGSATWASAGLSSVQSLTIAGAIAMVPNTGSPAPMVLQFDSAGNIMSSSYGVASGSVSFNLANGAAPLSITEDFSHMTQTSGAYSVSSVTQNGNPGSSSQLTGDNYLLKYDGTNWSLLDTTTNKTVAMTGSGTPSSPFMADGMNFVVTAPTTAGQTASFIIKPTINGASGINVAITDPALIAAASPIRTLSSTSNTGTGTISGAVATPPLNANLQDNVTITFDTPASTFTVKDTTTNTTLASNVAYSPGSPISYNGWTVSISGSPDAGDSFTVAKNSGATADNSNALLLAGLQTANTLEGGTTSFEGAYSQLVAQVGTTASQMQVTSTAQTAMVNQLTQAQQSISGVNLDEEAANLMRYQQAYQAAGKMLQIANTLFQSILQI